MLKEGLVGDHPAHRRSLFAQPCDHAAAGSVSYGLWIRSCPAGLSQRQPTAQTISAVESHERHHPDQRSRRTRENPCWRWKGCSPLSSSGSISGGLTLPSNAGSGAGSSTSGATGGSTLNGAAPPSFQAMPSLAEFLPAGYQLRPNSASDPVFQQAYAQWMASSAATSAANNTQTMQGGTSAAGSSSNPLTTSGAWSVFDGEFWRNYAHYLTNPSEMDDGLETGFYWSMGIAATAGTVAGGAVVWGAAGGSTFGVGVVKTCETSVIYTINGSIYMGSPTGVCNVTSCSWATMGYWTSCTGIPILSGESAIAGASGGLWFVKYPCLSRAIQAFANGWAPL